jgi:hypothetical protein
MTTFKVRIIALLVPLLAILAFASSAIANVVGEGYAGSGEKGFGLSLFAVGEQNENGSPDVQAGSHPYSFTTSFLLHELQLVEYEPYPVSHPGVKKSKYTSQGNIKDAHVELPPGFVGNPDATPRCTSLTASCPLETQVGIETTYVDATGTNGNGNINGESKPVYNLEPPAGVAAEFGFVVKETEPVFLDVSVRSGGDYGLTVNSTNISQAASVLGSKVTIWGVPAAPSHDKYRGGCLEFSEADYEGGGGFPGPTPDGAIGGGVREATSGVDGVEAEQESSSSALASAGECADSAPEVPLLTNPTSCAVPRSASFSVDDWEEPGADLPDGSPNLADPHWHTLTASLPELSGCGKLDFSPTLSVKPDGEAGSTPTGLNVDLKVPQESTKNSLGLAEADVKDTTVTLPAGVQVSPSAADGLQACSTSQIGYTGFKELDPTAEPGESTAQFSPEKPSCPDASKIANVKIKTPLLEGELEGSVYLAAPQNFAGPLENPFGSLFALYLVAEEPERGVLVKLAGKVVPNEATGQLTTTFENTPQLPFSDLKLEFYGTERAPLTTPAACGTYTTETSFAPWSGGTAKAPTAAFSIASGPNGSPCASPPSFSPSLATGMPNVNAGSFSDLTTTFSREDGQQSLSGITLHYPPGLSGILTGIPLCGEAEANAGTCGEGSKIGETIVSVGEGNDPFSVTGGRVYLTGPYDGAPFGLSIVNPAKAGPFDLQEGRPVIVRAKIEVNPLTAALTVTTTNEIPHIIDGIPLQIKHVNVNITRPGFTFNPTSCNAMKVEGTISSFEGASSTVSDPFQVTNCASLKFTPKFSVSTSGKTSKADGASLTAKLAEPAEAQGSQANIAKVKVELPKQLPSRLTTLQKACTNAQFESNPAGCPSESKIGYAVVHTPLLPVPLEGPAIFVSHGGEAFPSLTMVLQGYGVTVDLVGTTFISKAGVTSTTFKTVPDVPFSTFELTLPEGKFSALAANGNLCTSKLSMPTEFIGQNGAPIYESTPIGVTGCKPAITVKSHKVKGKTATIAVTVPAAGKLVATGKGLSKGSGKTSKAGTITVKLTLTKAETTKLKKHRGRKLRAKVKLTFTPKQGSKLTTTTTVLVG